MIRRFKSPLILVDQYLSISQTDTQKADNHCDIVGYETRRKAIPGKVSADQPFPHPVEEYTEFITYSDPNGLVKELVIFDRRHISASVSIVVDNPEQLDFYGREGTNHELDPH